MRTIVTMAALMIFLAGKLTAVLAEDEGDHDKFQGALIPERKKP